MESIPSAVKAPVDPAAGGPSAGNSPPAPVDGDTADGDLQMAPAAGDSLSSPATGNPSTTSPAAHAGDHRAPAVHHPAEDHKISSRTAHAGDFLDSTVDLLAAGGETLEAMSLIPIQKVTKPSELPMAFLDPSPGTEQIVGFDTEGIKLGRHGKLSLIQLGFIDRIYLVDCIEGGEELVKACKAGLESDHITKVVHDCKRDSEILLFKHGIKLNKVWDTQIGHHLIEDQEGRDTDASCRYISFLRVVDNPRYCGVSLEKKKQIHQQLDRDETYWKTRPLNEEMETAAANDVRYLLYIHRRMSELMNEKSLGLVTVRGALCSRCYCIDILDRLQLPQSQGAAGEETTEEEILEVVDFPQNKLGSLFGQKGWIFKDIRNQCKAYVFVCNHSYPERS